MLKKFSMNSDSMPAKMVSAGITITAFFNVLKKPLRARKVVKIATIMLTVEKYICTGSTKALIRLVQKPTAMPGM